MSNILMSSYVLCYCVCYGLGWLCLNYDDEGIHAKVTLRCQGGHTRQEDISNNVLLHGWSCFPKKEDGMR